MPNTSCFRAPIPAGCRQQLSRWALEFSGRGRPVAIFRLIGARQIGEGDFQAAFFENYRAGCQAYLPIHRGSGACQGPGARCRKEESLRSAGTRDSFVNKLNVRNYATLLGRFHADCWTCRGGPGERKIDTVKYRTDPCQAGQSTDPLSSSRRVNIAGAHVRSVSHGVVHTVSVFFLLQSIGVLSIIDRSIYGTWYGKSGDRITQTLNLLSIFASLFLFWSGTRTTRIARFNRVLPLAAASLLLISVLWSVDPRVTLTQGTLYFFVVLGVIGLVESSDGDVLMDWVALICGLSAVASVVQFFIFPEPGDFRGIFLQKNVLGQVMVGGVFAALHCARSKGGRRSRSICIIALCTVVAFMSKSATSFLTILVFFPLDILGKLYLRGGSSRIISICLPICCIPIVIFFVVNADLIFDLFGKDPTLTGRTVLWAYVMDSISAKPVLGWGFYAFWSPLNPISLQIAEAIRGGNWFTLQIANSHNTILEMLLGIGFVGTSFFIFLWVRNFVLAVKCMNGPGRQFGLSAVLLLIAILLVGMDEVVLLSAGQLWTSLFFMMGFFAKNAFGLHVLRGSRAGRVRARRWPLLRLQEVPFAIKVR